MQVLALPQDHLCCTTLVAELPELLKSLKEQPQEIVEREVRTTPYDTWPFFLAFVGVLSVEWFLRKKWGMV